MGSNGGERQQVADYFVVVGLGDSIRRYSAENELAENSADGAAVSRVQSGVSVSSNLELRQLELPTALEPITDIGVVCLAANETIPADYCCVSRTPGGHCANFHHGTPNSNKAVYLCFKRGRSRSPVTDIDVVYKAGVQFNFDLVERSITGRHGADLNHSPAGPPTNVCYRRSAAHSGVHFYGMAVTDLCVINSSKNEQVPRGFTKIDRSIRAGLTGPTFFLAYKRSLVKPHAVSYQAGILARFPATDIPDFPLPESVPLFCLPLGASIESWSAETDHPLPTFSSFVLTGTSGDKVYGAAVSFYEDLSDHESISQMKRALFNTDDMHSARIYGSKSICILSHFPYFDAFKSFLSSLYRISISGETPIPLERYISNFMSDVPFPSPKRPTVLLQLGNEAIMLSQPVRTPLPMSGANHAILLHALSAENLLTLLCLFCLEHKVILHSVKPSLLTTFSEALCSVLFPLGWQCPYIPLCPLSLASFIHAPIPFLIGIDSRFFDLYDTPDDVCCVNLDNNTIAHSSTSVQVTSSLLPKKPAANLLKTLKALQVQIPLGINLDSDLAVTVAPLRVHPDLEDTAMSDVAVREAFLRFFAQTLSGYSAFLRPLIKAPSEASTDVSQRFDLRGFQQSRPPQERPFFTKFFDTQLFNKFVEERSFVSANDSALVFFDECTEVAENPEPLVTLSQDGDSAMTVVVQPPDVSNLPHKTFAYPSFTLDPSLFRGRDTPQPTPAVPKSTSLSMLTCRRTRQEKAKSDRAAHRYIGDARRWSRHLLAHTYALWYTCLPSYVHLHPFKREAVTTAFKLLGKMHSNDIRAPDEVLYRILMEVCGSYGYPALTVRVLMEMRRMNISPNAVTYARYNKVALESEWPAHTGHWRLLRNVIKAMAQLRVRLKERRAIEASSAALAGADRNRIKVVHKALKISRRPQANFDATSLASSASHDGGDGDRDSLCSFSSVYLPPHDLGGKMSEVSSLCSHDERPTIVYTNAVAATPWSTDHLNLGASAKEVRSPVKGHRRGASATVKSNGNLQDMLSSLTMAPTQASPKPSAVTAVAATIGGGVLPSSSALGAHTVGSCRVTVTSALKDLDLAGTAAVVTMASCTTCHHCNCLVFDEQIMVGWQADDSDFNTRCPYCTKQLIAFLSVTVELNSLHLSDSKNSPLTEEELAPRFGSMRRVIDTPSDTNPSSVPSVYLCALPKLSIPYLSPLLLRKEVETLLEQAVDGLVFPSLVDDHSIIFWNLVWYFHRLSLPSHLSSLFMNSETVKQHGLRTGDIALCTSWHKEDLDESPPALYKQWIHRGTPSPSPVHTMNDSLASQLQSLTARLQCGEFSTCVSALLKERSSWRRVSQSNATPYAPPAGPTEFRGLYWDLLLLLVTVSPGNIDLVKFDREYGRCLQKLPRDLAAELRRDDQPLTHPALYFRRAFKALGMRHWS